MEKLIITAAVNGAEVTRTHTPHVPLAPQEIADAAVAAAEAGAAMVHVHARAADGTATQDRHVYAEIIEHIRQRSDVIVQVSTGGAVGMTAAERADVISLGPEMATLTAGTVNFGDGVFLNSPEDMRLFARLLQEHDVRPEIEVFDVGMIANALALVQSGLLSLPLHVDFVLGVPGGIPGELRHLLHLVESLPAGCTWTAAGVGRAQLPLNVAAILLGGHARTGLEDNIYYKRGQLAASNAQLVERLARIAAELGRELASPDEARVLLGISRRARAV
jgi:3-keto-5-aminohexanoate cleavage enzyme